MRFAVVAALLLTVQPVLAGEKEDDARKIGEDAPHMLWAATNCGGGGLTKLGEALIGGAKQFYPAQFDKGFASGTKMLASVVQRMGKKDACELYEMYFGPNGMVWKGALKTR